MFFFKVEDGVQSEFEHLHKATSSECPSRPVEMRRTPLVFWESRGESHADPLQKITG